MTISSFHDHPRQPLTAHRGTPTSERNRSFSELNEQPCLDITRSISIYGVNMMLSVRK